MLIRRAIVVGAALSLLCLGSACSSEDGEDTGTQVDTGAGPIDMGGNNPDTGSTSDMGEDQDTGVERDTGMPPEDMGTPIDMGGPEDMGMPDDVGVPEDMGTPVDMGMPVDIGMNPVDMGMPVDMGVGPLGCNPAFGQPEACGGNVDGNWQYREICGELIQINNVRQQCPMLAVQSTVHNGAGSSLNISGGTYTLNLNDAVTTDYTVPVMNGMICGMPPPMGFTPCDFLQLVLGNILSPLATTCTVNGNVCECNSTGSLTLAEAGTIVFNGGVATTTDSVTNVQRDYFYCASGNQAQYRERTFQQTAPIGPSYVIER